MKKTILFLAIIPVFCFGQQPAKTAETAIKPVGIIKGLSDSALLDVVQRQTFRYFWDFGYVISISITMSLFVFQCLSSSKSISLYVPLLSNLKPE